MTREELKKTLSKPLMRVSDYASIFDLSVGAVYDACARGDVKTVRVGKKCLRIVTEPVRQQLGLTQEAAAA